jgi:hypothetical protein
MTCMADFNPPLCELAYAAASRGCPPLLGAAAPFFLLPRSARPVLMSRGCAIALY